jgi:DNA-directed RNA polymerase subunit RPC12/RpoP
MGWIFPEFKPCMRCGKKLLLNDLQILGDGQLCDTCKRFLKDQEKAAKNLANMGKTPRSRFGGF